MYLYLTQKNEIALQKDYSAIVKYLHLTHKNAIALQKDCYAIVKYLHSMHKNAIAFQKDCLAIAKYLYSAGQLIFSNCQVFSYGLELKTWSKLFKSLSYQ